VTVSRQPEAVSVGILCQQIDQPSSELVRIGDRAAHCEIEVARRPRTMRPPHLQRHPAFEDPRARIACLEPDEDAFEQREPA
jgi:hypothetical protein